MRSAQGWGSQHGKPAIISGRYIGELGLRDLHQIARWAVENGLDELVEDGELMDKRRSLMIHWNC